MASTIKTWVNNNLPQCEDVDLNGFKSENNNLILGSGQSLSTGDLQQTHKAVVQYSTDGDFFADSGVADAYVLSALAAKESPISYSDGARYRFETSNPNGGGAATVNVAGLGVKNIKLRGGADPASGDIDGRVELVYDLANDWAELQSGALTVVGTATFTNATNNIALTGIGLLKGLEVGDVLSVTGTASNNTEFTVEVITDDDNVIVNQAHAGGATSKSLTNETVACTVTLLAKNYNASAALGRGSVNVAASKAIGVVYTNNTNRDLPIAVRTAGTATTQQALLYISGNLVSAHGKSAGTNSDFTTFYIVPRGETYRIETTGQAISSWTEVR